ncbi:hypothetical protein QR680_014186 [Steinernema hermaphroditum]|uniref:Uncharacterized protein n=1 Tax=Steinernema hermaphroditum TaxID=289476 RepID=A0AA39IAA8_9BILA|nr:hypothetical protein QR680_014186 [Steinernema hermaphroditum]
MDDLPALFYEEVFQVLDGRIDSFAQLSGTVGHLANSRPKDRYNVTAYISEHIYVQIAGLKAENGIAVRRPVFDVSAFLKDTKLISQFEVRVFDEPRILTGPFIDPAHMQSYLDSLKVSPENFDKLMRMFVKAPVRNLEFRGFANNSTNYALQIENFNLFKKYFLPCHKLSCFMDRNVRPAPEATEFFNVIAEFLRSPCLSRVSVANPRLWPSGMVDGLFDYLRSPILGHLSYIDIEGHALPPRIFSKWMEFDDEKNMPSRKVFKVMTYQRDKLMEGFQFDEIPHHSIKDFSEWMDGEMQKEKYAEHRHYWKLQHPKFDKHYVIAAAFVQPLLMNSVTFYFV